VIARILAVLLLTGLALAQNVVHYTTNNANVKYLFAMTVGAYRPVDDGVRIALTELVRWIHKDYGLSELDASELLSKVARIHLNEMVDPNYVVVASIEKKYLPGKK
jgi:uncharacterized protein YkwD